MSLDLYQPCPCGSGKKIKFCCSKDIVADLEKVMRAMEGEQRVAALDLIERVIKEKGERESLLALKSQILLGLGEDDAAESTIEALKKTSPHNPVALAQDAALLASKGETGAAVEKLQEALESTDQSITQPVYSAIEAVAMALLNTGDILGARGHLLMQAGMAGDNDQRPAQRLVQLNMSPEIPLLMKQDHGYEACPEDAPWRGEFKAAMVSARKGMWLAACESLESLAEKADGQPAILKNIAILRGWLGMTDLAVKAWREYANLPGVPLDDAVEAQALAQLLHPITGLKTVAEVVVTLPVEDTEKLMEVLLSSNLIAKMPVDPLQLGSEDSPPPKGVFWLLDRPALGDEELDDLTPDAVPAIVGELYLFGKETNRAARLEFSTTRNSAYEDKKKALTDLVGDLAGPVGNESIASNRSVTEDALQWRWHLPPTVSAEKRTQLIDQRHQDLMLNRWPELEQPELDGKSPLDVASDDSYRVRLLASILLIEAAAEADDRKFDFNQLREKLGLPLTEPPEATGESLMRLPLMRLSRVRVESLSDTDVVQGFQRAVLTGHRTATLLFGVAVLERDGTTELINKSDVFEPLIRACRDSSEALRYVDQAKQLCREKGESPAQWLLTELSIRLPRGDGEECGRLVQTLQARHMNEPGVGEALYRMLVAFGVITPEGQPAMPTGEAATAEADEPSKLWTPGSDAPSGNEPGKSKLWVPGG